MYTAATPCNAGSHPSGSAQSNGSRWIATPRGPPCREPQPGGDPPAGLPGGAEDQGGAVGHDDRFWRHRLGRSMGEAASPVYSSNLARVDAFGDLFRGVRAQGSLFGSSTRRPRGRCCSWTAPRSPWAPCSRGPGGSSRRVAPRTRRRRRHDRRPGSRAVRLRRRDRDRSRADRVRRGVRDTRAGRHPPPARLERPRPRHPADATTLIVGAYPVRGEIGRRLLDAVPDVLRVAPGGTTEAARDLPGRRGRRRRPGRQVVLDRLLDWMLVCTLREWFDRPGGEPPAWYAAHRDPVVGHAVALLHAEPATPMDDSLADRTGVSRATLAKRFAELVGEPPLTYLTLWRMTLAGPAGRARDGDDRRSRPRRGLLLSPSASARRSNGSRRQPSEFRRTTRSPVLAGSR